MGRAGIVLLLLAVAAVAGCGGGHPHAASASGAHVVPGAGGPPAQPVINGPASTGQAVGSQGGVGSGIAQGTSQVIGFPVGLLLPTTIDAGQCQAAQFADKSVYAQIAVVRATCAQVPTVAKGADQARGTSYSAAGFACAAIAQEPSNSYWISAYTTYNCRGGIDQIAFNWGTSSSRF